jgi:hypothetical protein
MSTQEKKMIDPPSGWRYGFPKELPDDVTDVIAWLIENGYPKEQIDAFGKSPFPYRIFKVPADYNPESENRFRPLTAKEQFFGIEKDKQEPKYTLKPKKIRKLRMTKLNKEIFIQLFGEGLSLSDIAKKMNTTLKQINILKYEALSRPLLKKEPKRKKKEETPLQSILDMPLNKLHERYDKVKPIVEPAFTSTFEPKKESIPYLDNFTVIGKSHEICEDLIGLIEANVDANILTQKDAFAYNDLLLRISVVETLIYKFFKNVKTKK